MELKSSGAWTRGSGKCWCGQNEKVIIADTGSACTLYNSTCMCIIVCIFVYWFIDLLMCVVMVCCFLLLTWKCQGTCAPTTNSPLSHTLATEHGWALDNGIVWCHHTHCHLVSSWSAGWTFSIQPLPGSGWIYSWFTISYHAHKMKHIKQYKTSIASYGWLYCVPLNQTSDVQTIGKYSTHGSLFTFGRSTTLHICRTGVKEVLPESLRSRNITDISERLEPREPSTDLKLHP